MSKTTELARAEADRAEAEAPDDEPTEPTEPTEPAPGEPQTDEEGEEAEADEQGEQPETPSAASLPPDAFAIGEALGKKLDQADKSQARAVERIASEFEQDTVPCPICERVDIAPRLVAKIAGVPAEGWQQIMALGGTEPEPEHAMAEGVAMCDRCNGYGELDYPTRNPHMTRQSCPKCTGNGYTLEAQEPQTVVPIQPMPSFPAPATGSVGYGGGNDQWGRPPGHPHYNLDPASVMP
jgi:hypothetical protein